MALAKSVRQSAGLMLDGMLADHERATGRGISNGWRFLKPSSPRRARSIRHGSCWTAIVDAGRMRRNLDMTGGLIVAEAAMMALAPHTGRNTAHDIVYAACRRAADKGGKLLPELLAEPKVTAHFDAAALERILDPANYLGVAGRMVDRLLIGRWWCWKRLCRPSLKRLSSKRLVASRSVLPPCRESKTCRSGSS